MTMHSHLINQYHARVGDTYAAYASIGSRLAKGTFTSTPITINSGSMPRYCGICERTFVTHYLPEHEAVVLDMPNCARVYVCGICSSIIKKFHNKIIEDEGTYTVTTGPQVKYRPYQALASLRFYSVATIGSGDITKLCHSCLCDVSAINVGVMINGTTTTICERCFNKSNRELAKIYRKCPIVMQLRGAIKHADVFSAIIDVVISIGLV